jgi:hypothetical protein
MSLNPADLVGKHLLIGLTYLDAEERPVRQVQLHGRIIQADESGLVIERADTGKRFALPPQWDSLQVAAPGDYRLRSTGEVVVNPDLLTTWTVVMPKTGVYTDPLQGEGYSKGSGG